MLWVVAGLVVLVVSGAMPGAILVVSGATVNHLPLTTHHSPPTTHHPLLITRYASLTTHHSLLTTYYSPAILFGSCPY